MVHHDLAPWKQVLGGERWVFTDCDNAGPGSRLWDLACAAHGFIPLTPDTDATSAVQRLAALADGYRPNQRAPNRDPPPERLSRMRHRGGRLDTVASHAVGDDRPRLSCGPRGSNGNATSWTSWVGLGVRSSARAHSSGRQS